MSEPCIHCKQPIAVPLRDIANRPVCGVCALQRLALIPRVLAALFQGKTNAATSRKDSSGT